MGSGGLSMRYCQSQLYPRPGDLRIIPRLDVDNGVVLSGVETFALSGTPLEKESTTKYTWKAYLTGDSTLYDTIDFDITIVSDDPELATRQYPINYG